MTVTKGVADLEQGHLLSTTPGLKAHSRRLRRQGKPRQVAALEQGQRYIMHPPLIAARLRVDAIPIRPANNPPPARARDEKSTLPNPALLRPWEKPSPGWVQSRP